MYNYIMDMYETFVKKAARWMHFDVVYFQERHFCNGVVNEPQWQLVVPKDTLTADKAFMCACGPIYLNGSYGHPTASALLHAWLATPFMHLCGKFVESSGVAGWPETIRVKNPFYGMSIDELKIKLDLIGA